MSGDISQLTPGEIAYYAGFASTSSIPIELRSGNGFSATFFATPRYFIHKAVQPELAGRMVAILQERPESDSEVNSSLNPAFATVSTEGLGEPEQFRIDERIDVLQLTNRGVATWDTIASPLAQEADRIAKQLSEQKPAADSGEALCYVVVRFFPGLQSPFPFEDFINLPKDNIDAEINEFLRNWAEEHSEELAKAVESEIERRKRWEEEARMRAIARPAQYDLIDVLQKKFSEDIGGSVDHLQPVKANGRSPLPLTLAVCDAINRLADLIRTFPSIVHQSGLGHSDKDQQPVPPDVVVNEFMFGSGNSPTARKAVLDVVNELKLIDGRPERVSADRVNRLVEQIEEDLSALLRISAYLRRLLQLLNRADVEYDRGEGAVNDLDEPAPPLPESTAPIMEAIHAAVNHVALWYKEYINTDVPKQRQQIVNAFRHPSRDSRCWPDYHVNKAVEELDNLMPGVEEEFIPTVEDFYRRATSERYNIDRQFARPLLRKLRGLLNEFDAMTVAVSTSAPGTYEAPKQQTAVAECGKEKRDDQDITDSEDSAGDGPEDPTSKVRQIRLANWAIAVEDGKTFRLFHRTGQNADWRESGKVDVPKGLQRTALRVLADKDGVLTKDEAVKAFQTTSLGMSNKEIRERVVTPTLNKVRSTIKDAIARVQKVTVKPSNIGDPLPYDKSSKAWRSVIVVGFAEQDDDGKRLRFVTKSQQCAELEAGNQGYLK